MTNGFISRRDSLRLLASGALTASMAHGFLLGSMGPAAAATLDEIKKRGYMTVATEDDFNPFEFVKDGKPTGFDNEMVELLRKYVPFEVRQEILPWTGILAGVATGKYDIAITAAIITKEREKTLEFTTPIADATHYYVKRKADASISAVKDLSGKTCGVQAGSALLGRLPELETALKASGGKMGKVVEYTSYPEAYQDLALGRTDYVVNTVINIDSLVASKPDVFAKGQAVSGPSYPAWAIKKGNTELTALMDAFIAEQKKTGKMAELQKKWFGKPMDYLPAKFAAEF